MRADLVVGAGFPDIELPDHTKASRRLAEIASGQPLVLVLSRGWW